jgi:ribosome-binding factor A
MRERHSAHGYPRTARVNELLREVIAEELRRIDDDDLALVSVTGVETEPDLRHAHVWVSSLDDAQHDALRRHRARLQRAIGRQVRMKRTPELRFDADPAIAGGARVEDILRKLRKDGAGDG